MTELITEIGDDGKFRLSLGDKNKKSLESTIESHHVIEELDIWLEIEGDDEVQRLKKLFEAHGGNVKKLSWINWSQYQLSAAEISEMLNFFPKLENLKFSSWCKDFTGFVGKLKLTNVKTLEISECDNFIVDFLSTALPENSIEDLNVNSVNDVDVKLSKFIKKQTKIQRLNVHAELKTVEPFTKLKLDYLRCILYHHDEEYKNQREFLHALIKSQVNLTSLDLFNQQDYSFSFVTDEIFAEICNLPILENLSISIDSITPDGIKVISNLTTLKHLTLGIVNEDSLEILREFGAIKNPFLESLVLNVCYEIPAETYEAIGRNHENLKSLTIAIAARHRISFFAKVFPNLESLYIKFGEENDPVEFEDVYDVNDEIVHAKLKVLRMDFHGKHAIKTELFIKFLSVFENLKKLQVDSKFRFSADFMNQLARNLNNIQSIELLHFDIKNEENFHSEIVDALKLLCSRLNSVSLILLNVQRRGSKNIDGTFFDFSYQPLIDALKDIYEMKRLSYANMRVCKKLAMHAGKRESWSVED